MKSQEPIIPINNEQLDQLIHDFQSVYGYDFTGYSKASFARRIIRVYSMRNSKSFEEFRSQLLYDSSYFYKAVAEISVNVTEMFRDVHFYKVIREQVIPILATYPHIRIWHAGCSTGEEVYSMAILLQEAGLLHKSLLYATDISYVAIEKAKRGLYALNYMQQYSKNYQASGGTEDFSTYYTANYGMAKFTDQLSEKMIYSTHNLVSDFSFNSFQLILCRNVLIYFDKNLQSRVLELFDKSLELAGWLALGTKESLRFSLIEKRYTMPFTKEKIYRKVR